MKLTIISGRSGSGKSSALHMLEDTGFYCVDNLPVGLMPELVSQALKSPSQETERIAVSIDARNVRSDLSRFAELLRTIPNTVAVDVIYLDADNATLIKRFSETRRKHPLSNDGVSLSEAIDAEKQLLDPISSLADLTVDTSRLSLHDLRSVIRTRVSERETQDMSLLFQSFGFKSGIPIDADMVFDVRCLPNPYWEAQLRQYSGLDQCVVDYLRAQDEVNAMLEDLIAFLSRWVPQFAAANRSYMTVAIGCTGGQHRSVFIAEALKAHFAALFVNTQVRHRELNLPEQSAHDPHTSPPQVQS